MAKNIVMCFDGTNNEFGKENTNVVRLAQVLDRDPLRQTLYYDPGVGTLPEPGTWSALAKWLSKVFGLAFGAGIFWKVQQAYVYLMTTWEPGDRVFLFGFSRGAYTARLFAAVLHQFALLPRGNDNLVPYLLRLFRALPHDDDTGPDAIRKYFRIGRDFRWSFARVSANERDDEALRVHFLGLWDTVSSVGWVWDPPAYPFTARNPSVDVIRHAISIDERRWFFRQNLMYQKGSGQDLQQMWFPGVHSDVGGGYPETDGGLWRVPFGWILEEAKAHGMLVDSRRLGDVLRRTPEPASPCSEPKHESLTLRWWPAEFFPKWHWRGEREGRALAVGAGRRRAIPEGALIHRCALLRLRQNQDYNPRNVSADFRRMVRSLPAVPDSLAYSVRPDAV